MIYIKTQLGQSALQNRSIPLTPRQRSAFILFDGKRDLQEVLKATAGLGITQEDVNHMVAQGLLDAIAVPSPASAAPPKAAAVFAPAAFDAPSQSSQAHYSKAYLIATRLTAGLGLRGFLLNLAVEGATDLVMLQELAPKIMKAVGPEKFKELNSALHD